MTLMRLDRLVMRFVSIGAARRAMLVEALAALAIASLTIRLLPFRRAVRFGSRRLEQGRPCGGSEVVGDARWSVVAIATRVPWRAACFQQGLALQWMLRRRGIDARLHYGIRNELDESLEAHVWIAAGETIVIGGEQAPNFKLVAVFP